jgi:hypothetical protein
MRKPISRNRRWLSRALQPVMQESCVNDHPNFPPVIT